MDSGIESGRPLPITGPRHLATGDRGGDGGTNYDEIATIPRKRDTSASAQCEQTAEIACRPFQCGPEPGCQSGEEGIANGSGEVPSLPKPKTFQPCRVLCPSAPKLRKSPFLSIELTYLLCIEDNIFRRAKDGARSPLRAPM